VQNAGYIAAIIHNVDSDRLVQMHGTTRKQQIILFVKQKCHQQLCLSRMLNLNSLTQSICNRVLALLLTVHTVHGKRILILF